MEENRAFIIIDKPSQLEEVITAINYFGLEKVTFSIISVGRIDEITIRRAIEPLNIEVYFDNYDFKNFSLSKFVDVIKSQNSKHVMLSINFMRVIYVGVPSLRKNGMNIIHLTDGLTNTFPLHGVLLAQNVKNIYTFFKSILIYFFYKRAKSDYCFYSLYPFKSCFSKKTSPLELKNEAKIPDNIKKELEQNKTTTLVVPGWGMSLDEILDFFKIEEFCATSKGKEFIINKEIIYIDSYLTAETLLRTYPIKYIYGTPSTVMYFAKIMDKEIECSVILDGHLNKMYGLFFEFFYKKVGKTLGINFFRPQDDLSTRKTVS